MENKVCSYLHSMQYDMESLMEFSVISPLTEWDWDFSVERDICLAGQSCELRLSAFPRMEIPQKVDVIFRLALSLKMTVW